MIVISEAPSQITQSASSRDLEKKFVIIDACLTNSNFVWINKHFYL
jgi:hypothetical protein